MTTEQQIKALAQLDGKWSTQFPYVGHQEHEQAIYLPPYLTSYDAIIPVIQKQKYSVVATIHDLLCGQNNTKYFLGCFTTAQLCEALLRATGKWEGEQ